jgi:nucleotide-binding universal stress UspA family protein
LEYGRSNSALDIHTVAILSMINLKRILTATDFSRHSQVALQYAAAFAKAFHAEVYLCHVLESPDFLAQFPPVSEGYFPPNLGELQEKQARIQCEQVLASVGLSQAQVLLLHGKPSLEIIQAAREEDVDLVILGTHGRGAVAHMLLGSIAEKVVRTAPCPVLTVRAGEHEFVHPQA